MSSTAPLKSCCSATDAKKLQDMIGDIQVCMMTTTDAEGRMHSRPMSINGQLDCSGNELAAWFFTVCGSTKCKEMMEHGEEVSLAFSHPGKNSFVSVSGKGRLISDRKEIEKRWNSNLKTWFPRGLDEPGLSLLRVVVDKAEYWDSPSGLAHAVSFIKSALTGRPEDTMQHKEVTMQHGLDAGKAEKKETMRGEEAKMKETVK